MYTRCPKCDTVFHISREQLEAAGGDVRCGRCSGIFNAREALSETLAGLNAAGDQARLGPSARDEADTPENDASASSDRTLNDPAADDAILEFNLPDDQWGEVFIDGELDDANTRTVVADSRFGTADADDITDPRDNGFSDSLPSAVANEELAGEDEEEAGILVEESDASEIELYFGSTFPGDVREAADAEAAARIDTLTAEAREDPAGGNETFPGAPAQGAPAGPRWQRRLFWGFACFILLAGVLAQLVHLNRDDWAALPWAGNLIEGAYRMAGSPLDPHWNVNAYRIVAAAAAAQSQAEDTLRIRAEIENTAERAQPYPLVRLTLTDRWGDGISARVLEPREYAGANEGSVRLLEPGQPFEADIMVVDPGDDAFGFELAVCLRDAQRRVQCSDQE